MILAVLLSLLVWMVFWKTRPEPTVRFISLIPPASAQGTPGLPTVPNCSGIISQRNLNALFVRMNQAHEKHVTEPQQVASLSGLENSLKEIVPGEKVVVYCGLESVVRIAEQSESEVGIFLDDGSAELMEFTDLLDTLKDPNTDRIILLMDLVGRSPGLANGILADDVVPLIDEAVANTGDSKLTVIRSSDAGQRSWEYINESAADNDGAAGEHARSSAANIPRHFSGTVFAHFISEAFKHGKTDSVKMLHEYLKSEVSQWVKREYNEDQTVSILPALARNRNDLLLRAPSMSPQISDELEEDAAASSDTVEHTDVSETPARSTDIIKSTWSTLMERRAKLPADTAAVAAREWMQLDAALVAMRHTLLHGMPERSDDHGIPDITSAMTETDSPDRILDSLERNDGSSRTATDDDDLPRWISVTLAAKKSKESAAEEEAEKAERAQDDARDYDRLSSIVQDLVILPESYASNDTILPLPKSLNKHINEFADSLSGKLDWPHEWFAITEVSQSLFNAAGPTSADTGPTLSEQDARVLATLGTLITLRRDFLTAAAGQSDPDSRMLKDTWDSQLGDVKNALTKLNAAESWLSLGSIGLPGAHSLIKQVEADKNPKDAFTIIAMDLEALRVRSQHRAATPALIQFLAQQLEQRPLGKELEEVANTDGFPDKLPEGVESKLGDKTVKAMFGCVEDLRIHSEAERTVNDTTDFSTLKTYLTTLVADGRVSAKERLQLLTLPLLDPADRSAMDQLMQQPVISSAAADAGRSHTGIWLGYWSIRLLEALTSARQEQLRSEWRKLVIALHDSSADPKDEDVLKQQVVVARTKLAMSLQDAWQPNIVENREDLFVPIDQTRSLLASDLAQRTKWNEVNRTAYEDIHTKLVATPVESDSPASLTIDEAQRWLTLEDADSASLRLTTNGGTFLFVMRPPDVTEFHLKAASNNDTALSEVPEKHGRFKVPVGQETDLRFTASGLTEQTPVVIALADEHEIVLATEQLTISPSYNNTRWAAWFFVQDEKTKEWKRHKLTGGILKLPPNGSTPLKVRLVQTAGLVNVQEIRVTCRTNSGKEMPITSPEAADREPVTSFPVIEFADEKKSGVEFHLGAPMPDGSNDPGTIGYDVADGFTFEIAPVTPVGLERDAAPFLVRVNPLIVGADQYIHPPRPKYDPKNRKLEIPVDPRSVGADFVGLKLTNFNVELHLSSALSALASKSTYKKIVSDRPDRFEITFNRDPFESRKGVLEFSMAVAEIPDAFRWNLEPVGPPRQIGQNAPEVRAELELTNGKAVKLVQTNPFYVVGMPNENATEPKFDVWMHIHGFESRHRGSKLGLKLKNTDQTSAEPLMEPVVLNSRFAERITVAPGADGVWSFQTIKNAYVHRDLQLLNENNNFNSGIYDVIAQLSSDDGEGGHAEIHDHFVKVVIDQTKPLIEVLSREKDTPYRWNADLEVEFKVTDDESGIDVTDPQAIEVKLGNNFVDSPLPTVPGGTTYSFRVPAEELFPDLKPGDRDSTQLIITAQNRAGMSVEVRRRLTIARRRKTPSTTSTPVVKTGAVNIEWDDGSKRLVRLMQQSGQRIGRTPHDKKESGEGKVRFEKVPVGNYRILWKGSEPDWEQLGKREVEIGENTFGLPN